MDTLQWLVPELSRAEWLLHGFIFFINITLLIFSGPIIRFFDASGDSTTRIKISRSLNVLVLLLHIVDMVLLKVNDSYQHYAINLGLSLMAVYSALFLYSFSCALSKRRFGVARTQDEKTIYLDTYSTRLVDLILLAVFVLTTVYVLIKIWGADSLLETTGIFGIVFAFLAFTSGQWAPDVLSGLVMLNSQTLEDGDLIKVEGYKDEFVISRITFIYTVLFDIHNNNRTLLRNSRLLNGKIDNLSRIASSDGIRRALKYNIGYPDATSLNRETRVAVMDAQIKNVDDMFGGANKLALEDNRACINESKPFEWAMTSAGDDALEYTLWVYLERIPSTKVTATMRKHYAGTINRVNELVYRCSVIEGLQLATPKLAQIALQADSVQDVSEFGSRAKPQEQSDKR